MSIFIRYQKLLGDRVGKLCVLCMAILCVSYTLNANTVSTVQSDRAGEELKTLLSTFHHSSFHNDMLVFPDHPMIERFRRQYMNKHGLEYLSAIMKRSAPYRQFIIDLLAQEGMPAELLFLPVIESGFSEKATSRSGAAGIWQFMKNSVGGYNIHINDWVDERYDPWKTSVAAIKKLKWNYSRLKDWPLALAAYNCGMGAVQAAIKKGGKADYWYLADNGFLKKETMYYVPKFLAIVEILSKSEELGITWGSPHDHPPTLTIDVNRAIDIGILAKEAGIEAGTMKKLNPSLRYSITPPNTRYALRIPQAYEETVKAVLEQPNTLLLKYYQYRIKSGDTLYALALHYGVSVESIVNYNPGLKPSTLKIGKVILIPALKSVDAYTGKTEQYAGDFSGSHVIESGDTLWSLALKYTVSVELLAQKNNLAVNSVLKLGKILKVPIL